MVDFIKLLWRNKTEFEAFIKEEENFPELTSQFKYHTGEVEYPLKANLNHYQLNVSNKQGHLKNSIHKDFNTRVHGEEYNYNDFSYSNLCESIDYLSERIPCLQGDEDLDIAHKKDGSRLTQLEFGFNIDMGEMNVADFINNQVLMHKYKSHSVIRTFNGRGTYKQFNHDQYAIKIYDKGKQYNLTNNLLRFEIRFNKSIPFQKVGIFKLEDLKSKMYLRKLFLILIKRFDEMIIVDTYNNEEFNDRQRAKLIQYKSHEYWIKQRAENSNTSVSRNQNKSQKLFEELSLLSSKIILRKKLVQKFIRLINS